MCDTRCTQMLFNSLRTFKASLWEETVSSPGFMCSRVEVTRRALKKFTLILKPGNLNQCVSEPLRGWGAEQYAVNNIYIGNNGPPTRQCLQLVHARTHARCSGIWTLVRKPGYSQKNMQCFFSLAMLTWTPKKKASPAIIAHLEMWSGQKKERKHMFWPLERLLAASVALSAPALRTTQTSFPTTFNICQTASCQAICSVFTATHGFKL